VRTDQDPDIHTIKTTHCTSNRPDSGANFCAYL
jgi:hypothetical protein